MSSQRLPSVKTLCARLGCDSTIAGAVRHVLGMNNRTDAEIDQTLKTVSVLLHGYGVEYLPSKQDTHGKARGLEYVNMGDTYRPTIIYDCMQTLRLCIVGRHGRIRKKQVLKTWR